MTSDAQTDQLRDRIRYWEGVLDRAHSIEYASLRALAIEANTYQGSGPKTEAKVRAALVDRATKRLHTLRTELGMQIMGARRTQGLRW